MASNVFDRESEVIETLPDRPHQPKSYSFPKKTFGKSRTVERCAILLGSGHGLGFTTMRLRIHCIATLAAWL